MSIRADSLKQTLGKTIAAIVIRESVGAGPRDQIFVVFTDNTYIELYGDMGWSSTLEVGDLDTVKRYAVRFGGHVEVIS